MEVPSTLREQPFGPSCIHVCVDMQRVYLEPTEWQLPWFPRVLPNVVAITERHVERTIFTRFITGRKPGDGVGIWRRYYSRWAAMTQEQIAPGMLDLAPDLARLVPPAEVIDKPVYSPWLGSNLHAKLAERRCDTVIVTGGETDMCVLATVLGAADLGFRTILVQDAVCSASDEAHDAMLSLFTKRYGQLVETSNTEEILKRWV